MQQISTQEEYSLSDCDEKTSLVQQHAFISKDACHDPKYVYMSSKRCIPRMYSATTNDSNDIKSTNIQNCNPLTAVLISAKVSPAQNHTDVITKHKDKIALHKYEMNTQENETTRIIHSEFEFQNNSTRGLKQINSSVIETQNDEVKERKQNNEENDDAFWDQVSKPKIVLTKLRFFKSNSTQILLDELQSEFDKVSTPPYISIMYGIINSMICLPVLMSFGRIIYQDDFFRPYLPALIRITVVSGIVHQLSFSTFSTLPFSVGQVQDAGLISLSTMASDIVKYCKDEGRSDDEILATTVVGLSMFTALLGVALVIISKFKLATYVELLPISVVGGYLAFIGFFCGQGGFALMSKVQLSGIRDWHKLLDECAIVLSLPGIACGICIYVSMRKFDHVAVLPCALSLMLVFFYIFLTVNSLSREEATELGWISDTGAPSECWYHTWDVFNFGDVVWSALPGQSMTALSMIVVVALSSSLDIAAIDLEIAKPLEYNYELLMIGLSNILSGLSGGYTGSYIFSQTIFSLRAGIRSRLMGYVIAICEAITVIIPISILSFVPNFVFGSFLVMICIDLMVEWLWHIRSKMANTEYIVTLATFVLIQLSSVVYGMIGGSLFYYFLSRFGYIHQDRVSSSRKTTNGITDEDALV